MSDSSSDSQRHRRQGRRRLSAYPPNQLPSAPAIPPLPPLPAAPPASGPNRPLPDLPKQRRSRPNLSVNTASSSRQQAREPAPASSDIAVPPVPPLPPGSESQARSPRSPRDLVGPTLRRIKSSLSLRDDAQEPMLTGAQLRALNASLPVWALMRRKDATMNPNQRPLTPVTFIVGERHQRVKIKDLQNMEAWDYKFKRYHLARYEEGDPVSFKSCDPEGFEFLCHWMCGDWRLDKDSVINNRAMVDIKTVVNAALVTESFRCPKFWAEHVLDIFNAAQRATDAQRFILDPIRTMRIDQYTPESSPIRKMILESVIWHRDIRKWEDFELYCDRACANSRNFQNTNQRWTREYVTPWFKQAVTAGLENKARSKPKDNPFLLDIAEAVARYSYDEGFEWEDFPDPLAPAGEVKFINNTKRPNTQ